MITQISQTPEKNVQYMKINNSLISENIRKLPKYITIDNINWVAEYCRNTCKGTCTPGQGPSFDGEQKNLQNKRHTVPPFNW